jgi:glutamate racemase
MAYIMRNWAIGILDSGVGGLTVAKEVMRQLPRESILYFGDTLRCPYGPRPKEEVRLFTLEVVEFLMRFPLKAILIACNTATAAALDAVRACVSIPVLGVIEPGARAAIKASRSGRIGVIGTQGTIQSGAYEQALKQLAPGVTVFSQACPRLVPLVEGGHRNTPLAREVVEQELMPLKEYGLDTLILGCTHYPLLSDEIAGTMGEEVAIISSAEETAAELKLILSQHDLHTTDAEPRHHFFTTGEAAAFARIAEDWLGEPVRVDTVCLNPAEPVVGQGVSGE